MSREQNLYQWLRSLWIEADYQRIETTTGPGVPDVNMCLEGHEVWLELKCDVGGKILLRKEQYAWGIRRSKHGGRVFIMGDFGNRIYKLWQFPGVSVTPYSTKYLQIINGAHHILIKGQDNDNLRKILFGLH